MKAILKVHIGLEIDIDIKDNSIYVTSPKVPGLDVVGRSAEELRDATEHQLTTLLADNHNLDLRWLSLQMPESPPEGLADPFSVPVIPGDTH